MSDPANMSLDEIIQAARDNARKKSRGGGRGRGRGERSNRGRRGSSRGARNSFSPSSSRGVSSNRRGRVVLKRLGRNKPKPLRSYDEDVQGRFGRGGRARGGRGGRGGRKFGVTVSSRARPRSSGYAGSTLVFTPSHQSSSSSVSSSRARGGRSRGRGTPRGGRRGRGGIRGRLGYLDEQETVVGNGRRTTGGRTPLSSEARARLTQRFTTAKVRRAKELLHARALKRAAALLIKAKLPITVGGSTNTSSRRGTLRNLVSSGRSMRPTGSGNVLISVAGASSTISRPRPSSIVRSQPRQGVTVSIPNDRLKLTVTSQPASTSSTRTLAIASTSSKPSVSAAPVKHVQDLDPVIQKHIASVKAARAERTKQQGAASSCEVFSTLIRQKAVGSSTRLCERFESL